MRGFAFAQRRHASPPPHGGKLCLLIASGPTSTGSIQLGGGRKRSALSVSAGPCMPPSRALMVNQMVQYSQTGFDASFAALSDATRRGVLEQLGRADASITDLANK